MQPLLIPVNDLVTYLYCALIKKINQHSTLYSTHLFTTDPTHNIDTYDNYDLGIICEILTVFHPLHNRHIFLLATYDYIPYVLHQTIFKF